MVAFLLGTGWVPSQAWAASEPTELMVRLRQPIPNQGAGFGALANAADLRGATADVVNADEGVVKLSFDSVESLARAQAQLEHAWGVESVSKNFLYKPALHLEIREQEAFRPFVNLADITPAATGLGFESLPDVLLPAAQQPGPDPLLAQDYALASVRMPAASSIPVLQKTIVTAVIDTGVDYNHEDLIAAMWRSPKGEVGYDFAHGNAKPYDVRHFDIDGCMDDVLCSIGLSQNKFVPNPGHGTHCAGHVGAVAGNSLGIQGLGLGTQIMALKFFYDFGESKAGSGDTAAAVKSIDYAVKNGARVISASWGNRAKRAEAEKAEVKKALIRARDAGVLVVIAAGNDGINQETDETPDFPAAYELDNTIVVAAVDAQDELASFSNFGAKSVHLAAPGVKIFSTTAGNQYADVIAKFKDRRGKDAQIDWNGTSMATPIVAGAAALLWSRHPNETYHQIRERILSTVRVVPGLAGKVSTGGVLDVTAALNKTF